MRKLQIRMAYNSYVILDEKIAIMDTVDAEFAEEWLHNMEKVLGSRKPDYLIIQHMESDHSANIKNLVNKYPEITLVASAEAFVMMEQFFGTGITQNQMSVKIVSAMNEENRKQIESLVEELCRRE